MSAVLQHEVKTVILGVKYFLKIYHDPEKGPAPEDQFTVSIGSRSETDNPIDWLTFKRLTSNNKALYGKAYNARIRKSRALKRQRNELARSIRRGIVHPWK